MRHCENGGHGREHPRRGLPGFMRGMRGGPRGGFGGFGGEARGEHRRRGGGGRMFGHGALKWLLLSLIGDKPSHGYELIKAVETKLGGAYSPSPGVIYPTLTLLEEMGALSSEAEGGKKLYSITDEGRRLLVENAEALAGIEAVTARFSGRGMRPEAVEQAIHRLRGALRGRMTAETPLSEAQVEAIVAAIHAAAEAVEKS
ncbi:PadR family transcriptional regulator [Brevundimonas sp. Leaf363]|uniref:PadR family transcriptional regulator n=1 Tax=Brevundimonas sp. Leaf363 TaxID=1736353 RepID=UPI000A7FC8BA|nr:PadR family transcriptional regulator [Brevundimonas sp. Leaf363]